MELPFVSYEVIKQRTHGSFPMKLSYDSLVYVVFSVFSHFLPPPPDGSHSI